MVCSWRPLRLTETWSQRIVCQTSGNALSEGARTKCRRCGTGARGSGDRYSVRKAPGVYDHADDTHVSKPDPKTSCSAVLRPIRKMTTREVLLTRRQCMACPKSEFASWWNAKAADRSI